MEPSHWTLLGQVAPRDLVDARVAAHYAAQPVGAAAARLAEARADHSHTNLIWSNEHGMFHGRALVGGGRCELDVVGLRLAVRAADGSEAASIALAGRSLDDTLQTVASALGDAGHSLEPGDLELPAYDMPESALTRGGLFPSSKTPELTELGRWFANAARALQEASAAHLGGAEVRCWPHHFDLAALWTLPGPETESARSVNVGFSPGDDAIPEPYFYVTPWPIPEGEELPELEAGASWHTDGFTAAVLTGTDLVDGGDADAQARRVHRALRSSIAAAEAVVRG